MNAEIVQRLKEVLKMKGSWPDARKIRPKRLQPPKAEDVNQNHYVKDYGMTIQQQYQQTKVIGRAANQSMVVPFHGDNLYLVEHDGDPMYR